MRPQIRIIKVGGSLLDWSQLPSALEQWLQAQSSAVNILVAGGGQSTESIWQASQTFALSEEAAHWLCIDAMSVTSRLLAAIVTNSELVTQYKALKRRTEQPAGSRIVFDASQFSREHESSLPGAVLPRDWTVSSDSIAARLAEVLHADQLVLLKSSDPPAPESRGLAEHKYVDEFFPAFDRCRFRRRFVNLRGLHLKADHKLQMPRGIECTGSGL